jgi:transcriptional regulator with XRE-family HTH domain
MSPNRKQAMTKTEFGKLVERYLAIKGNSATKLAKEIGVGRNTIWRWQKGERKIDSFTAASLRAFFLEKLGE